MATGVVSWSQTAANNATADSTVNYAEGQAPSSLNDSARAAMASVAKFRDDTNGSITTGGTSTAFTVTTNQSFASLTALNTHELAFTMHTTSGATPTLSVDSLTAKPIRHATGATLPTAALLSGSVYRVKYDNSAGEFLLVNQLAKLTVADGAVTYAKIQNVAASSLLGNPTGSSAATSEITLGAGLAFSGTTLASAVLVEPQGYLTLTSATPIITGDVASATAVYYTPFKGNVIPIYDGSSFVQKSFSEITLTLVANHLASQIYDVFVINDSGTIRAVTGPAWTTATAGSCARGTGAGTTELQRLSGVWTNAVSITGRYGASTTTVSANQGTYVGSIFMDGTNGQVSCHRTFGQSRKWGVWNAYNRRPIMLLAGDATASWTSAPSSWRQSRADATNFAMAFSGLPEEPVEAIFKQYVTATYGNNTNEAQIGIGVNSTTVLSGGIGVVSATDNISGSFSVVANLVADHILLPSLGINQLNMLEQVPVGTTTAATYAGGSSKMRLNLKWQG
jgi:hypothetical protein